MDEESRRASASQSRCDLARDMARLSHAADYHATGAGQNQFDRTDKAGVQAIGQGPYRARLDLQSAACAAQRRRRCCPFGKRAHFVGEVYAHALVPRTAAAGRLPHTAPCDTHDAEAKNPCDTVGAGAPLALAAIPSECPSCTAP